MENLQENKISTQQTLEKLTKDEGNYKSQLQFDKDGSKCNLIILDAFSDMDSEAIGKYLINLSASWKPPGENADDMKIGTLYGFDLCIRRQKETYESNGLFQYHYRNLYYAESKETNIKYSWNQGYINIDNPKIAARHFLNAIDRVDSLKEKYEKNLQHLNKNIPMLQQIIAKPFEKEIALAQLKKDISKLEREITLKIQENQMKQNNPVDEDLIRGKEAPVISMDTKKPGIEKSLLPKKEFGERKDRGLRM